MNKYTKAVLFGLLIWVIPFLAAFFVWNPETNAPAIPFDWFSALMAVTFAIGLSISICYYFRNIKKEAATEGWIVGIIWFATLVFMDLIVLVGFFGSPMTQVYPVFVNYLSALIIAAGVGHMLDKR